MVLVVIASLMIGLFLHQNLQCSFARNLITFKLIQQFGQNVPSSNEFIVNAPSACGQWVYAALGFNAWDHKNWYESISYFQKANSLGMNIIYSKRIGDIYHLQGDDYEAIKYWFQAGDYPSLMTTADEAYRSKQWDLAKTGYQLAVNTGKMEEDEVLGHFGLGNTFWHGYNDIYNAEAEFLVAIREKPDFLEVYLNLGDMYFGQGDTQRAAEWFQQAIGVDPKSPKPYYEYALMKYKLGDYISAEDLLNKSLGQDPNYKASVHLLDVVLEKLK